MPASRGKRRDRTDKEAAVCHLRKATQQGRLCFFSGHGQLALTGKQNRSSHNTAELDGHNQPHPPSANADPQTSGLSNTAQHLNLRQSALLAASKLKLTRGKRCSMQLTPLPTGREIPHAAVCDVAKAHPETAHIPTLEMAPSERLTIQHIQKPRDELTTQPEKVAVEDADPSTYMERFKQRMANILNGTFGVQPQQQLQQKPQTSMQERSANTCPDKNMLSISNHQQQPDAISGNSYAAPTQQTHHNLNQIEADQQAYQLHGVSNSQAPRRLQHDDTSFSNDGVDSRLEGTVSQVAAQATHQLQPQWALLHMDTTNSIPHSLSPSSSGPPAPALPPALPKHTSLLLKANKNIPNRVLQPNWIDQKCRHGESNVRTIDSDISFDAEEHAEWLQDRDLVCGDDDSDGSPILKDIRSKVQLRNMPFEEYSLSDNEDLRCSDLDLPYLPRQQQLVLNKPGIGFGNLANKRPHQRNTLTQPQLQHNRTVADFEREDAQRDSDDDLPLQSSQGFGNVRQEFTTVSQRRWFVHPSPATDLHALLHSGPLQQ